VQLALLVLLCSVFFSGFFLPLTSLLKPVWIVSYALPVTYGVRALQSLMLRGQTPDPWVLWSLAGMAAGFALISALLFQRGFRRR
jgi:ABC-2 type transport system permease protein